MRRPPRSTLFPCTTLYRERTLDLRAGLLRRSTEWQSPGGRTVRVTSTRLVSLVRRSIAAIQYRVEVTDDLGDLYVRSEEHTSELQPRQYLVCRLLLEKHIH